MKEYKSNIPELELRRKESNIKKVKITQSRDAAQYIRQLYHEDIDIYESSFAVFLNRAMNTIGWVKISQGGITGTVIDPRLIVKYAVDTLASSVVISHNHPSGNITPSEADKRLTKKIQDALSLFDITLLDHIILTSNENKYFSFADEGLLHLTK